MKLYEKLDLYEPITKEEIEAFLVDNDSMTIAPNPQNYAEDGVMYVLDIDDIRSIDSDLSWIELRLETWLSYDEYGLTADDVFDLEDMDVFKSREHSGNPVFDKVVASLTEQANDWIYRHNFNEISNVMLKFESGCFHYFKRGNLYLDVDSKKAYGNMDIYGTDGPNETAKKDGDLTLCHVDYTHETIDETLSDRIAAYMATYAGESFEEIADDFYQAFAKERLEMLRDEFPDEYQKALGFELGMFVGRYVENNKPTLWKITDEVMKRLSDKTNEKQNDKKKDKKVHRTR